TTRSASWSTHARHWPVTLAGSSTSNPTVTRWRPCTCTACTGALTVALTCRSLRTWAAPHTPGGADDRPGNALWLPMGSYGSRALPNVSRRARGATKNRQGKNHRGCRIPNGPVGQSVARRKEDGDSPMTWHQWDDDTTQAALDGARLAYRHPQVRQAAALEDVEQDALEYIATHPDEVEAYKANGWTHVLVKL